MLYPTDFILPNAEPPSSALVSLETNRYGFSLINLGVTLEDIVNFEGISICKTQDYNYFGDLSNLENELANFLSEIGPNEADVIEVNAKKINQIARQVLNASGKEAAWIGLFAALPSNRFDIPNWHFDRNYYDGEKGSLRYKFVLTLVGPSTRVYPLLKSSIELRQVIWKNAVNRQLMVELFGSDHFIAPKKGEGLYFLIGNSSTATLHSEPPFDGVRLFLSIVPCKKTELEIIKNKIRTFYKLKHSINS